MSVYGNLLYDKKVFLSNLNEAFFGKSDILFKIENQIGEIRNNYKKLKDMNSSEYIYNLNRLFEQQFGMEIFSLNIFPSKLRDAFTCPIACKLDAAFRKNLKKSIEATQNGGFRFKLGNNLCIIIYMSEGIFMDPIFTNGEIVAIILHELGHNFADAISETIAISNMNAISIKVVSKTLLGLSKIHYNKLIDKYKYKNKYYDNEYYNELLKKDNESKPKGKLAMMFDRFWYLHDDVKINISDFFSRLSLRKQNKIEEVMDIYENKPKDDGSVDRQNEVLADKFAGIYGYGVELASGLNKLESPDSVEKFLNKFSSGKKANENFIKLRSTLLLTTVHPHTIQRLNSELTTLKYELKNNKNIDIKLKTELINQINELEKLKKEITEMEENKTESEKIRIAYNALVDQNAPNAVKEEIEKSIDQAIDSCIIKK